MSSDDVELNTLKSQMKAEVSFLNDETKKRLERLFAESNAQQQKELATLFIAGARYQKVYNKAWFGALVTFGVMLLVLIAVLLWCRKN